MEIESAILNELKQKNNSQYGMAQSKKLRKKLRGFSMKFRCNASRQSIVNRGTRNNVSVSLLLNVYLDCKR